VQGNDSAAVLPQRNVLSDDTLHTFLGTESVHLHLKKKNLRTCCVHADISSFYRPDSFVRFHFVQHRGNCACSRPRTESSCCDNETRRRASDLVAPRLLAIIGRPMQQPALPPDLHRSEPHIKSTRRPSSGSAFRPKRSQQARGMVAARRHCPSRPVAFAFAAARVGRRQGTWLEGRMEPADSLLAAFLHFGSGARTIWGDPAGPGRTKVELLRRGVWDRAVGAKRNVVDSENRQIGDPRRRRASPSP